MEIITRERVIDTLRDLVAEAGEDFVYRAPNPDGKCLYQHDGKPSCLIGQAFARWGVDIDTLASFDQQDSGVGICANIACRRLTIAGKFEFEGGVEDLLRSAQADQDTKYTWGFALARAEAKVDEWAYEASGEAVS